MRKILILIALFLSSISLISCNSGDSSSSSPGGVNGGVPSDVQLLPTQYIAQTNSSIYFKTRVLDGNGRPVKGEPVTYTNLSPVGTIHPAGTGGITSSGATVAHTDSLGYATIRVFASTSGFVTIQSEVNVGTGHVRDKKTVYFSTYGLSIPVPFVPPPTMSLSVDGEDADTTYDEPEDFDLFETADDDEVIVLATVSDGDGGPAASVEVTFGADSTEATFPEGAVKTTDSFGRAQVRVKVTPASLKNLITNINITASALVDGKSAFSMVTLFVQPIVVGDIVLNADPAEVIPTGTSEIQAYVSTTTGAAVPDGTTVTFTAAPATGADPDPCGFVIPFGQTTDGLATATFSAPSTPGTCTITGTSGGLSGNVNVLVTTDMTVIPASQTIAFVVGNETATYTIIGGTGPFTAYSDNPSIVSVGVAGTTVTATGQGTVPADDTTITITVVDTSDGTSVDVELNLDVPPLTAMSIIPPSQTIVDPAFDGTETAVYNVIGGQAPYDNAGPFSSHPSLVSLSVNNTTGVLTATLINGATPPAVDTTVTITVFDNLGASATAALVIDMPTPIALAVIPAAQTVVDPAFDGTDADVIYNIIGGVQPYTVFSGNPVLVAASITGAGSDEVTADIQNVVTPPIVDTTVTLTVYDNDGSSVTADLILDVPGVEPLALKPTAITVTGFAEPDANTSDDVTFLITGGTGPYSMFSNNAAIIASQGDLGAGVSTFTVDPDSVSTSTDVTLTVQDSLGATVTATVTITPPLSVFALNPSSIGVLEGDSVAVFIQGGTGPYNTYTTDTGSCVAAPGGGSLPNTSTSFVVTVPGTGCGGQTHTITLEDSLGQLATFTITIGTVGPIVTNTIPANGAIAVTPDSVVTITWSVPVDCTTVNTTNVSISPDPTLWTNNFPPPGLPSWTRTVCAGNMATFTPNDQDPFTTFTVTVSSVEDVAGNPMGVPYVFFYTIN